MLTKAPDPGPLACSIDTTGGFGAVSTTKGRLVQQQGTTWRKETVSSVDMLAQTELFQKKKGWKKW